MTIDLSGILQFFLGIWSMIISFLMDFLPVSPIGDYMDYFSSTPLLGWINWFIPVGTCVAIAAAWAGCIAAYYIFSALLRWAKMIA